MTDHLINRFARLSSSPSSTSPPHPARGVNSSTTARGGARVLEEGECTFCDAVAGRISAFKVYEDEQLIAILDILPLRSGHILLLPKRHHQRIDDLPDELAAHIGSVLPKLGRALCRATANPDWNLVSNQGYAQTVPHVHYHLIPAPVIAASSSSSSSGSLSSSTTSSRPTQRPGLFTRREELDDAEAEELAKRIRAELAKEEEEVGRAKL